MGRSELLLELSRLASDAEQAEVPIERLFWPTAAHTTALDPQKLIVRGERGAGKTALFRFLHALEAKGIGADEVFPLQRRSVSWVEGYGELGMAHPPPEVLAKAAQHWDDETVRHFWTAHLCARIFVSGPLKTTPLPEPGAWIRDEVAVKVTTPEAWFAKEPDLGPMIAWLDSVEQALASRDQYVFVTYDFLDRIGATRPDLRRRFVIALTRLWLGLSNRYQRIRGKIFLREDLFQHALKADVDASKLESRSVSLRWSVEALYQVLIRHLLVRPGLQEWLSGTPMGRSLWDHPFLGLAPPKSLPEEGEASQRAFVLPLAGEIMGLGVKKGYVYRWIPAHLQDAYGAVVPRSIVNLFASAAQWALDHGPQAPAEQLLHSSELEAGLARTSRLRVRELAEEHPVVARMQNLSGLVVMAERQEVVSRLRTPVQQTPDAYGEDGEAALDELLRLGVLKVRPDGRLDVPDLYRYGYGVKRKGGIARPR